MIYTNPPLCTTTLIANLKTDGLSVNDENFAEDFLNGKILCSLLASYDEEQNGFSLCLAACISNIGLSPNIVR